MRKGAIRAVSERLPCICCGTNLVTITRRGPEIRTDEDAVWSFPFACAACLDRADKLAREVIDGAVEIEDDEDPYADPRGSPRPAREDNIIAQRATIILSMAFLGYLGNSVAGAPTAQKEPAE